MANSIVNTVVEGIRTSYGANRKAATGLFDMYGKFYLVQDKTLAGSTYRKTDEGKAVKAIKKELYDALKALALETGRNINPSKVWGDICGYGKELDGIVTAPKNVVTGDGERDEQAWIAEKLLIVYKHIQKLDTDEFAEVQDGIGELLTEYLDQVLPE